VRVVAALAVLLLSGCGGPAPPAAEAVQFGVSRGEFELIFPGHSAFYSYEGFVSAGGAELGRRDAAQFLANVAHETGGLKLVEEEQKSNYGNYCDMGYSFGCPAGKRAYYGRGPLQLSWNYNYQAAGEALGVDLLNNPEAVAENPGVSWGAAMWFWNTRVPHGGDFGGTIDAINGSLECRGGNPEQVRSRVDNYRAITAVLGVDAGDNLTC
jgi:predicted chitinase